MGYELTGRVALVTGGGRGIGRAIAQTLAAAGAAVAVVARTGEDVTNTAREIEQNGGRAVGVQADVTSKDEVAHSLADVERELGPIDVLVNNAGTCNAIGPVWEVDPDEWWRDVEINLRGAFLCARAVLPSMLERHSGRIINVSSYAATRPDPYRSSYASSKLAILRFTDSLAAETRDRGVFVFAISPGTVQTTMTEHLALAAEKHNWPVDWPTAASTRWISPKQAGELAVVLASGQADALSGRFLHVLDDIADLIRQAERVQEENLYTVGLRRL